MSLQSDLSPISEFFFPLPRRSPVRLYTGIDGIDNVSRQTLTASGPLGKLGLALLIDRVHLERNSRSGFPSAALRRDNVAFDRHPRV